MDETYLKVIVAKRTVDLKATLYINRETSDSVE